MVGNVYVLLPINVLGNIQNIVKGLLNIVVKLIKVFRIWKRASTPKKAAGRQCFT